MLGMVCRVSVLLVLIFFIPVYADDDEVEIVGQKTLRTDQGKSITLSLSDLVVKDEKGEYPGGFSLKVFSGENYKVSGATVTPVASFTGTLNVPVRVEAHKRKSEKFTLKIEVTRVAAPVNVPPKITGQVALTTTAGKSIAIQFSHLHVTDPDDNYPNGFTLKVSGGSNYTVNENVVTPLQNFTGTLSVPVVVNDGKADSDPFSLKVEVAETSELQILGQTPLEVSEDSTLTLRLEHLVVNDPSNRYPTGFSLQVSQGENYAAEGTKIIPVKDFHGNLKINVTVSSGQATSKPFELLIVVKPVNDLPIFSVFDTRPVIYNIMAGAAFIAREVMVEDVDDDELILAEIGIQADHFRSGLDELVFEPTRNIRGTFDADAGILNLIGKAPLDEYQEAIRSIQYRYNYDSAVVAQSKTIYFRLNDGKSFSELYEKEIVFRDNIDFDIPSVFTPNNDSANDTWKIQPLGENGSFENAIIRVFNKRGQLVYETTGFEEAWDGKFNGEVLPVDTYYYIIEINERHVRGVVTILH